MAARLQIVKTQIPSSAITAFKALARSKELEEIVAPQFASTFGDWLRGVASAAARDYAKRSGRSSREIFASARSFGGRTLASIRGHFLVSPAIAANEYGATIVPKNKRKLAVPMPDALYPDGSPKRRGPLSWKHLGTFVYKSRRTGQSYLAYRSKNRGLVLLYILLDRVVLSERRYIRNAYDRLVPMLYAQFYTILGEGIEQVYTQGIETELRGGTYTARYAPKKPSASTYATKLLPRY